MAAIKTNNFIFKNNAADFAATFSIISRGMADSDIIIRGRVLLAAILLILGITQGHGGSCGSFRARWVAFSYHSSL